MTSEELNNSPRILAAAATEGRPLTIYAINTRSNGTAGRKCFENSLQESLDNSLQESLEN